jgi:hypothetical protein
MDGGADEREAAAEGAGGRRKRMRVRRHTSGSQVSACKACQAQNN